MKLTIEPKFVKLKTTNEDKPRGTVLLTGMPRVGKTRLAAEVAGGMVGFEETFLVDFPEEEGTGTLADLSIQYATVYDQKQLDEVYTILREAQPKAIIFDGLASLYWMLMKLKIPSGIPPEDHGKTWMEVATKLRGEITRFKIIESVEWFIATSLVWPDKDEITGKEGRLQVVLPGQLKSNLYGHFSYNINLTLEPLPSGGAVRVAELQPTVKTVAGVRAPYAWKVPARVQYDLAEKGGLEKLLTALRIGKGSNN